MQHHPDQRHGVPVPFGPPDIVGAISLVVLALALVGLYVRHLNGVWRPIYVISAVLSLDLNAFVGVVQAFNKLTFLKPLAAAA